MSQLVSAIAEWLTPAKNISAGITLATTKWQEGPVEDFKNVLRDYFAAAWSDAVSKEVFEKELELASELMLRSVYVTALKIVAPQRAWDEKIVCAVCGVSVKRRSDNPDYPDMYAANWHIWFAGGMCEPGDPRPLGLDRNLSQKSIEFSMERALVLLDEQIKAASIRKIKTVTAVLENDTGTMRCALVARGFTRTVDANKLNAATYTLQIPDTVIGLHQSDPCGIFCRYVDLSKKPDWDIFAKNISVRIGVACIHHSTHYDKTDHLSKINKLYEMIKDKFCDPLRILPADEEPNRITKLDPLWISPIVDASPADVIVVVAVASAQINLILAKYNRRAIKLTCLCVKNSMRHVGIGTLLLADFVNFAVSIDALAVIDFEDFDGDTESLERLCVYQEFVRHEGPNGKPLLVAVKTIKQK